MNDTDRTSPSFDDRPPHIVLARSALLFDIDGTLLDIAARPDEVRVPGDLAWDLAGLADCVGGALALVSGRPLAVIDELFSPLCLPAIGCHGAEIRPSREQGTQLAGIAPIPESLRHRLSELAARIPGVDVEDKNYSVALHYRAVPRREAEVLEYARAICAQAPSGALEVLRGKCVVEVKIAGFDKGTALRALMAHSPFRGRRPVFVGDDITDENALAVLPEFDGVGIAVGRALAGASFVFDDPEGVRQWLGAMLRTEECQG